MHKPNGHGPDAVPGPQTPPVNTGPRFLSRAGSAAIIVLWAVVDVVEDKALAFAVIPIIGYLIGVSFGVIALSMAIYLAMAVPVKIFKTAETEETWARLVGRAVRWARHRKSARD